MSLIDTQLHYLPLNKANRYELTPLIDSRWHDVTLIDTHIRYHAYVRVVGTSCNSWSQHAFCSEVRRPHHFVACIEPGTHIEAPSPSKPNGMFWSRDISVQVICTNFWNTEFAVRSSFLLHDSFDSSCFLYVCSLTVYVLFFFALRFHLPWVETESSSIIQECAWGFDSKCSPCEITGCLSPVHSWKEEWIMVTIHPFGYLGVLAAFSWIWYFVMA